MPIGLGFQFNKEDFLFRVMTQCFDGNLQTIFTVFYFSKENHRFIFKFEYWSSCFEGARDKINNTSYLQNAACRDDVRCINLFAVMSYL